MKYNSDLPHNKKAMDADVNIKHALSPKVVGYCVRILEEYIEQSDTTPTEKGFVNYYIEKYGRDNLIKSANMISLQGYSIEDSKMYVYQRVFNDTWVGKKWEIMVMEEMLSKGFNMRFSTTKEDYIYNVDLVSDTFALQVKPITYYKGNNPSLLIDKKKHFEAHDKYESEFMKPVIFAFYDKGNNTIIYKNRK